MRRWVDVIALLLLGVTAGGYAGWYLRGLAPAGRAAQLSPAPAHETPNLDELVTAGQFGKVASLAKGKLPLFTALLTDLPPGEQRTAIDAWVARYGESFDTLMYKAGIEGRGGSCTRQVDLLLSAALAVKTTDQQQNLNDALSAATDGCARHLLAEKRFGDVDHMYEQVTLAMPELAGYFLKLGRFRIRTGNFDGALAVLSQIENHGELGAEARQLIRQAEASEAVKAPAGEDLSLRAHGGQFVVNAVIDGGPPVPLLIDTGAAMTVIDASLLTRLGYSLSGRQAWFATAGGVVQAPVVSLKRLALGDAAINELSVGALPLDMPDGVQGLLGMNFLRHFDFRIDQQSHTLHLDKRG